MNKLCMGLPLLAAWGLSQAATFAIEPVRLAGGSTITGTVSTDGSVGPLTAAQITGWDLTVRQVQRHVYTPTNASAVQISGTSVSPDGRKMFVRASPDGVRDGGILAFGSFGPGPEYGVQVADFTGYWGANGGVAFYLDGAAFEWSWFSAPNGSRRLVAKAATGSTRYRLQTVTFPSGSTLTGNIVTDGSTGPLTAANLLDWHLVASDIQTTRWFRDATGSNSAVLPGSTGLSSDGQQLFVARPGGWLGFGVAARPPARGAGAVLADFGATAPGAGQAGYFNAFGSQMQPLKFSGSLYPVGTLIP